MESRDENRDDDAQPESLGQESSDKDEGGGDVGGASLGGGGLGINPSRLTDAGVAAKHREPPREEFFGRDNT